MCMHIIMSMAILSGELIAGSSSSSAAQYAAKAYDDAVIKYFGELATVNFPQKTNQAL